MRNLRIILLLLLYVCLLSAVAKAIPERPYTTNFPKEKYGADNKNWSIGQDDKGITYFGNDIGLLEFDGIHWTLNALPNRLTVRSLAVLSYHTVFTGSYEEFGRWDRDVSGVLHYTSLSEGLDKSLFKNDDFWKIWADDEQVYFQSFNSIFVYDYQTIERIPLSHGILFLSRVRNEYWVQEMQGDLYRLEGRELQKIAGSECFRGTDVRVILPYRSEGYLIGTATNGIFLYDGKNFTPWHKDLSELMAATDLNCGLFSASRDTYIFGTILNGLYEVNTDGEIVNHISVDNMLQNNTVLSVFEDDIGNIWVGLDRGLSYIQYLPKMSHYIYPQGNFGSTYAVTSWNGKLIIGTNQAVFYIDEKDLSDSNILPYLTLIEGSQGQVWSFFIDDNRLYCCHNRGLKEIHADMTLSDIYRLGTGVYEMSRVTLHEKRAILLSAYTSLKLLDVAADQVYSLEEIKEPILNTETDHLENVWLEHFNKGVYRCRLSEDLQHIEDFRYYGGDSGDGLPYKLKLFKVRERVVLLGNSRFFIYDDISDAIVPNERLNDCFSQVDNIRNIIHIEGSLYWALTGSTIYKFSYDGYNAQILEAHDISALNLSLVNAYEKISVLNDSVNMVCLDNGFLRYNNKTHTRNVFRTLDPPFLSACYGSDQEGMHYYGKMEKAGERIPYRYNSVTFRFSARNSFASNLSFQYKLEGIDKEWSAAAKVNSVTYARLPEGKYTLQLRTENNLGSHSEVISYEVEILPPWYRTVWAYLLFLVLACGLLVGIWMIVLKRYRDIHLRKIRMRETKRLRKVNEQLQQEVQAKNAELLTQTFFVVQRNELLMKIKDELQEFYVKQNNRSLMPLFNKVNALLNANMNTENDWKSFLISFEQKHAGLFKKLKDAYPQLTSNDLRLCACLKLNLDSKDIASLMNVSVRAVENSRSRLRKKLNIPSNQSLSDFFMHF